MNSNYNNILKKLEAKNDYAKMRLEEIKLEYKKQILKSFRDGLEILNVLEQQMNIPKDEVINKLSSDEASISFLDQTLVLVKKNKEKKNKSFKD